MLASGARDFAGGGVAGSQGARRARSGAAQGAAPRFGWPSRCYRRRSPIGPIGRLARLAEEIASREGVTISRSQSRRFCAKKGVPLPPPRHTLKGRQDKDAVDRIGRGVKLRKAQAEAGDIVLLFADESEALTHRPTLARAWAMRAAPTCVCRRRSNAKIRLR